MGGRGASSGGGGSGVLSSTLYGSFGGFGSFGNLVDQANQNSQNFIPNIGAKGDYTDDNNPNLLKYQQQTDDKTADFLAGTDRNVNLNDPQYNDGFSYHDLPLNRLLARLGIKKGPTVLTDKEFDQYCQQTGQNPMYRGWSGKDSAQRFLNTVNNHVGNGVMGDGYYFSPDRGVALRYSGSGRMGRGEIMRVALSPNARVVDLADVRSAIGRSSGRLQSALDHAGHGGSGRTFGSNDGEARMALKMGYNVIRRGNYLVAITNDALVVSRKVL